jgi:hypothetical protein
MFAASKTASVGGYQISRSLRFNSADSTYLNRTLTTPTDNKKFTLSMWIKRSSISATNAIISTGATSSIYMPTSGTLVFENASGVAATTAVFRDFSAWYHLVFIFDSANATANDRMIIYVNNVRQALSTNTTPSLNATGAMNSAVAHYLGSYTGTTDWYNGYMTEVNFIDGQALTPSSFGETNAQTGVWSPVLYRSPYGTNGFYINFSDNSNTTAATLGKDYSGNGNNWTPNNFSVTAGAGNDSLVDSPTSYGTDTGVGGSVRGNYSTWNSNVAKNTYALTYANGNLQVTGAGNNSNGGSGISTIAMSSGKWYSEFVFTSGTLNNDMGFGIVNSLWGIGLSADDYFWKTSYGYQYSVNAVKANNNATTAYGATYTTNDVIGIAFDADAGTLTFYKNGTSQGTAYSSIPAGSYQFAIYIYGSTAPVAYANFGQRAFAYTAPSGFKALCTQNLPTPTIGAASATLATSYFNPVLYTGTGSSRSVTGVGFQPDWTWIKSTSTGGYNHHLVDAVRGVTKDISSNLTNAESTDANGLTAFGSDGFTVGSSNEYNALNSTFIAWNWKANGAGSSNTSGSITSTVSASTTSGFSVVTYTGSGVAGTIGHGLGVAPSMIIVKSRSATGAWPIYHSTLGNGSNLVLNTTAATATSSTIWNSTSPTSSVFSVGINTDSNTVTVTYVAYCFASIAGYSAFGSYTGNGSNDGPFVFTGFRPAYIIRKRTDTTSDWLAQDRLRIGYNATINYVSVVYPDTSGSETQFNEVDILSNGFKIRASDAFGNASGGTYIYMALAQNPFKYSLAR